MMMTNLQSLPKELFLYICSYLDARFLVEVLSLVHSDFAHILKDPISFRIRIKKRWPDKYPLLSKDYLNIHWSSVAIAREEQNRFWSNPEKFYTNIRLPTAQGIFVDAVLLTEDLIISGSRDRSMDVWRLEDLSEPFRRLPEAHTGWIWDLCFSKEDTTLYSSSWDTSIKIWDLEKLIPKSQVKCQTAVLTTQVSSDIFVAGTFDKKVIGFDRKSNEELFKLSYHKKPVLTLSVDSDYVISGSEDHSIVFYDRKANKKSHSIHLKNSYPMSMSRVGNVLYVGDKRGNLYIVDVSTLSILKTQANVHTNKITGIHVGLGSIITCSSDGTILASQPDLGCNLIGGMKIPGADEITGLSVNIKNTLVTGHEGCVKIWKLEDECGI